VIGLPRLVRTFGETPKDELVLVPVRDRPFKCQGDKGRIECLHDLPHRRIAWRRQLTCLRVGNSKPVQGGDTRAWPSECEPFNERDRLR